MRKQRNWDQLKSVNRWSNCNLIIIFRINFWIHAVIIKLLPCFILTIISFVLIDVLCRANKRKLKLKGYGKAGAAGANLNGQRLVQCPDNFSLFSIFLCTIELLRFLTFSFFLSTSSRANTKRKFISRLLWKQT